MRSTGSRGQFLILLLNVSALTVAVSCAGKYVTGGGPEAAEKARILLKLMQFIGAVSGGKTVTQVALNYLMCKGEQYHEAVDYSSIALMPASVQKLQLICDISTILKQFALRCFLPKLSSRMATM